MRKTPLILPIAAATLLLAGSGIISAQSPSPTPPSLSVQSQSDLKTLNSLIADLQVQQKAISDNQALIDQKLATLTETIRVARIFTKRGGAK